MMLTFEEQAVLGIGLLVLMLAGYAVGWAIEGWTTRRDQRRRVTRMARLGRWGD